MTNSVVVQGKLACFTSSQEGVDGAELPRLERRLPKHVLTASEAELVLAQPDTREAMGVRDRAISEVLYSTGIRRMEVVHLSVYDLDAERGTLMVRQGKGKKDRMVPIGEQAIGWLERYLNDVRPGLLVPPDDGVLSDGDGRRALAEPADAAGARLRERRRHGRKARATCFGTRWRP